MEFFFAEDAQIQHACTPLETNRRNGFLTEQSLHRLMLDALGDLYEELLVRTPRLAHGLLSGHNGSKWELCVCQSDGTLAPTCF